MKKTIKIILNIVKYICLTIFVAYVAILAVQKFSNNNASIGGIRVFTIVSESMVPDYNIGDIIIVKKVDANKVKVGDDVCYLGEKEDFTNKVVTHRVKEVINNDNNISFITEGIANVLPDPEVKSEQLYGKVIYKTVILSSIGKLLKNKVIFFFIIIVPVFIFIFIYIWKLINSHIDTEEDDEDEEDEEE